LRIISKYREIVIRISRIIEPSEGARDDRLVVGLPHAGPLQAPLIFAVTLPSQAPRSDLRFFLIFSGTMARQCPLQDGQSFNAAPPTLLTW